jgi:DNA-binding PadR family transcriptional regulator
MKEIERRTDGVVDLGPGTLYRSIKHLLARKLIIEVEEHPQAGPQRRSYALTPEGRARTAAETRRLQSLVRWAADAMALEGGQP